MKTIYQLKKDQELLTEFLRSNFMIGTSQWWEDLRTGELPLFKFKGDIVKVVRNFFADAPWVDVEAKSLSGEFLEFHRQGYMDELIFYRMGSNIEVDYVKQNCRNKTLMTKIIPVEIRAIE